MRSVLRQHGNIMLGSSALSPYLLLRVFLHKESLKRDEMSFWNCFHVDLESRQAGNRKSDETDREDSRASLHQCTRDGPQVGPLFWAKLKHE